jgi:hypothetical protein
MGAARQGQQLRHLARRPRQLRAELPDRVVPGPLLVRRSRLVVSLAPQVHPEILRAQRLHLSLELF